MRISLFTLCSIIPSALLFSPTANSRDLAIRCTHSDGSEIEIYIIKEEQRKFVFFNRGTKEIEPICSGNCNWSYTLNRISFENPRNGFIVSGILNRARGTLLMGFATGGFGRKVCSRTALPTPRVNKF